MLGSLDVLAVRLRDRLFEETTGYQLLDPDAILVEFAANFESVLKSCRPDAAGPSPKDIAEAEARGADRERRGIPLEDVLRGWRVGVEIVFEHAQAVVQEFGRSPELVIDFTRAILRSSDLYTSATARGHRHAELEMTVASIERQVRLVRQMLLEEGSATESLELLDAVGLPAQAQMRAFCAPHESPSGRSEMARWVGMDRPDRPPLGIVAAVEQHLIGFFVTMPAQAPTLLTAVGSSVDRIDLPRSFREARRTLRAAVACGMTPGLVTPDDLGLMLAVHDDLDVRETMSRRYLVPVLQTHAGEAVLETVRSHFSHRQQVHQTAAALFVHANTVRYRLNRFEELTGADLRDAWTIAEVAWALRSHALEDGKPVTPGRDPRPGSPLPAGRPRSANPRRRRQGESENDDLTFK